MNLNAFLSLLKYMEQHLLATFLDSAIFFCNGQQQTKTHEQTDVSVEIVI